MLAGVAHRGLSSLLSPQLMSNQNSKGVMIDISPASEWTLSTFIVLFHQYSAASMLSASIRGAGQPGDALDTLDNDR
jgi:hypothetical protein